MGTVVTLMGHLLLADGTGVPDPTDLVDAAASGNAVKFLGAVALVAVVLLVLLFWAYVRLMDRFDKFKETAQAAKDAEGVAGRAAVETLRVSKDTIIAAKDVEIRALLERVFKQQDRLRLVCERVTEMEQQEDES